MKPTHIKDVMNTHKKPTHQAFRKELYKQGFEVITRRKDDYIIEKDGTRMVLRRDQLHRLDEIYEKMIEVNKKVDERRAKLEKLHQES